MNETSRRKFLAAAAAGASAGAISVVGLPMEGAGAAPRGRRGQATEPVVAWIEDPFADQLVLMAGEREVVVRDRDLVSRILRATGGE